VGVFSPALERHVWPEHLVRVPLAVSVADWAGDSVRQSAWFTPVGPVAESISQLMFFDGE
jgi:hypothetical protein